VVLVVRRCPPRPCPVPGTGRVPVGHVRVSGGDGSAPPGQPVPVGPVRASHVWCQAPDVCL